MYKKIALIVVLFFFFTAIYHYLQRKRILDIYTQLNEHPAPKTRLLPLKDHQEYIRILSIEGGGVRGIIPLHVLRYLEQESKTATTQLFDLMVGTSTGAIAVSYLTTPGDHSQPLYSAAEILQYYNSDAKAIFNNPWYHRILTLDGLIGPKYTTTSRYEVFKKHFLHTYFNQLLNNVVIPTYDIYQRTPLLCCNWTLPNTENINFSMTNLLLGATSTPGIFPTVIFGSGQNRLFLADGALYANNPNIAALLIAMSIYPNKKYILVSLETGQVERLAPSQKIVDWGLIHWVRDLVPVMIDSASKFNTDLLRQSSTLPLEFYQFNIRVPPSHASLDDTSAQNIADLNALGRQCVEDHKDQLNQLINKLLTH